MTNANGGALLHLAQPELGRLIATVLDAPDPLEGGAFALFGMRETATSMVFTLAELITPEAGEIGWGEGNVRINHPYLRRVAKLAQTGQLAVGFVHRSREAVEMISISTASRLRWMNPTSRKTHAMRRSLPETLTSMR